MIIKFVSDAAGIEPIFFTASIGIPLLGAFEVDGITFNANASDGVAYDPVRLSISETDTSNGELLLIAFQFDDTPSSKDLLQYVEDRQPVLEKYGGKVLMSAITSRSDSWRYDGLELIKFPLLDTIQELMGDDDYRARTSSSSSVFGGDFAVAQLDSKSVRIGR